MRVRLCTVHNTADKKEHRVSHLQGLHEGQKVTTCGLMPHRKTIAARGISRKVFRLATGRRTVLPSGGKLLGRTSRLETCSSCRGPSQMADFTSGLCLHCAWCHGIYN
eukprot:2033633-Amphidinium_carterae.1